jgi:hypothetical protein
MIVNFKYFYEKTDTNYDEYKKLWGENRERMIILQHDLSLSTQTTSIIKEITDNKDILAIHSGSYRTITHNVIVNNIMLGRGFIYANNKVWYPKEVWVYNPINN